MDRTNYRLGEAIDAALNLPRAPSVRVRSMDPHAPNLPAVISPPALATPSTNRGFHRSHDAPGEIWVGRVPHINLDQLRNLGLTEAWTPREVGGSRRYQAAP
jgi:hypothetical protein